VAINWYVLSVPLIAFLPKVASEPYKTYAPGKRSHSQIFPTSLSLMGYSNAEAERYDTDLLQPSKRIIWFGRNVIPLETGEKIEFHVTGGETPNGR
jgi:hypothetical protein